MKTYPKNTKKKEKTGGFILERKWNIFLFLINIIFIIKIY